MNYYMHLNCVISNSGGRLKTQWLHALWLTALLVAATSTSAAADSLTGKVSDAMCGAEHMEPGAKPSECTRICVGKGSKYALVVGTKVYTLDSNDKATLDQLSHLAGTKAKVSGTVKGDEIEVISVAAAK
jgi:hypothetical protein